MYFYNSLHHNGVNSLMNQDLKTGLIQPSLLQASLFNSITKQIPFLPQNNLEKALLQMQYINNRAANTMKTPYIGMPMNLAPMMNQNFLNLKLLNEYNNMCSNPLIDSTLLQQNTDAKKLLPILDYVQERKMECVENLKLKNEEAVIITGSVQSEPLKANAVLKKVPKKKAQNRIKNIPGLIMQRVRSSIKYYYTLNSRFDQKEKRLKYVDDIIKSLNKVDKERLNAFLEGYQKNWKTWNTIQKFLQSDEKYGEIVLDIVLGFFSDQGQEDFNEWLNSGKMGDKSKNAVNDMKDHICKKFSKIIKEANIDDMISQDKMVKSEDSC